MAGSFGFRSTALKEPPSGLRNGGFDQVRGKSYLPSNLLVIKPMNFSFSSG